MEEVEPLSPEVARLFAEKEQQRRKLVQRIAVPHLE
jgi:hypothetical protein